MGPIGAHVRILPEYEMWVKALETMLGSRWKTYIVHSFEDGRRLKALADRAGVRDLQYTVFRHQTVKPVVDRRPPGVLFAHSTLHVDSPWVWMFLLDSFRLETNVRGARGLGGLGWVWGLSVWVGAVCGKGQRLLAPFRLHLSRVILPPRVGRPWWTRLLRPTVSL